MVAQTAVGAAVAQVALAEEPRPEASMQVALEDQLVAAVAVLVEAPKAVLVPGMGPPEASPGLAWTRESPSNATGSSTS